MMKSIQGIKNEILSIDVIFQGTIIKQYKQCGRVNCRCLKNTKYWHGPYLIWTRKEKGKTVTKTLKNAGQMRVVKNGIENLKRIAIVLEKWKMQSLKNLDME
jgi:hypothetical protein